MKILGKASIGIGFGVLLLWVALSQVDIEQGRHALANAKVPYLLLAIAAYWVAIVFRIARWRLLLGGTHSLGFGQVSQALIVGYAVNNVLPARLGEIFRADFLRRRFGVSRSGALGSIIVERLMDGMAMVLFLGIGLTAVNSLGANQALVSAAIVACVLVVIGLAAIYAMLFWHERLPLARWPWLKARVGTFVQGMMVVRGPELVKALALSGIVWCIEAAAIHLILRGFGVELTLRGTCLTIGIGALSTLLPSAPGYLGSLQIAYVLAYSALGLGPILGVLSATAVQLLLLGSVTLTGLLMLVLTYFHGAATSVRKLANRDETPQGPSRR